MLIDELKNYTNGRIAEDKELSMSIGIKEQYPYGSKPNPPEILLAVINNVELDRATTFEGEQVADVYLQIIVMANQMNIGGKKYSAQKSCSLLSENFALGLQRTLLKKTYRKF